MKASPFHTVKWRLLAAALVFLLFAATFDTLRLFLGEGATAFSLIPVIVVTWLFGVTPGLVSAILTILITTLIVCLSDGVSLLLVMQNGGTAGLVTTVMVVFITGYFHGLQKRLKQELVERKKTEETLRQTEKIFQRMFDQSPIGAAIVTLDYRYQHANQAFCQMVGYTEEELSQHTFTDITDAENVDAELVEVKRLERGDIDQFQMDKRYIHHSGSIVWVHLSVRLIRGTSGEALYFFPMMVDITERKIAEASLAKESSINAALVDLSRALMSETSLTDIPGRVLEHAMRLTKSKMGFVGYIDPQTGCLISTNRSFEVSKPEDSSNQSQMFRDFTGLWGWVLKNKKSLISNNPTEDPRSSGVPEGHIPIRRFLSAPAIIDERLIGQIAVANSPKNYDAADLDIVERLATLYGAAVCQQQSKEKYHALSIRDPMTGLHNRRYYEEELLKLKESHQYPVSIIMCDIDGLKNINDRYGHADGDEILRRTAKILRSAFRAEDIIARIGGDEFVILLPHTHAEAAAEAVRRIYANLTYQNTVNCTHLVMLSLGSATAKNQVELEDTVKKADSAMYLEKQKHRISTA